LALLFAQLAEGKNTAELEKDLQNLMNRWTAMCKKLPTAHHPSKVLGELNKASSILRDVFNDTFTGIHIDDEELYQETKDYLAEIAPEKQKIVKYYQSNDTPLFEKYHIERQIKTSFGRTVSMSKGAYLIIEHTEALHVIDVNSGGRNKGAQDNQESSALAVNIAAAKEIARQLRLRDMGGIVVIDFIDMKNTLHRKELFDTLRDEMKLDRARHTILPASKFGLIQLTRERVRPVTNIITVEKCPTCDGSGEIKASILLIDDIENNIRYLCQEQNEKSLTLHVHPYLAAYLKQGKYTFNSYQWKWFKKYKKWIAIDPISALHFMEYHFFNNQGEEIKL